MSEPFFRLLHVDTQSGARRGRLVTPHGAVETPAFMPVGTQGTVKGVLPALLRETGTQMILANTYHLMLRPGEDVVSALGGLHEFVGWSGPILTDSGGFQIFSLAKLTRVDESAAVFRSHVDGSVVVLSPERAVAVQEALGADIIMALDHVIPLPASREAVLDAMERSIRWAERCRLAQSRHDQRLFAIVQGGLEEDLRIRCACELRAMDFPGYAVGGLSVGETPAEMYRILDVTTPHLPKEKPRYLMGVGRPTDLLEGVRRGIDLFDCVMPTRNGRNAMAFTHYGPIRIRNQCYERDSRPLEDGCACPACRFPRAYLRHLFMSKEMLGPILLTLHNITYYQRLMRETRDAVEAGCFAEYYRERIKYWESPTAEGAA
ncbi:tRNA guanosine(34) transglycosylase Tgt [Thermopirellula anaerolimosa]